MRRSLALVASAALLRLAPAAAAWGADGGVEVEAGKIQYQRAGSVLEATGGVKASWDGNELVADSLRFERDRGRLVAEGGLRLEMPGALVRAESCELLIDEETGTLTEVEIDIESERARFGGAVARKLSGKRFALEKGYFTTCDTDAGHAPDWSLTGSTTDVEVDGYGRIRDATLRIRGVPMLYTPYMVFPVLTRRQTGLLMPSVGASSKRGFIFDLPFFWAIDKHRDLTATAGVETSRRLGLALEYRYRPSREVAGEVELRYYNEAIRSEETTDVVSPLFQSKDDDGIPENRLIFSGSHRQRFGDRVSFYADALLVTDDLVLRETESVETGFVARSVRRTRRYTDSRLGVLAERDAPGDGFATWGYRGTFYQDLIGPDRFTLQKPAQLWGKADGDLGLGVSYALDGEFSAFDRRLDNDGQRADLALTVERPLITGATPVRSSAWLRGRLTGYHNDNRALRDVSPPNPPDDTEVGEFIDRLEPVAGRMVAEGGIDLRTGVVRTYRLRGRPPEAAAERPAARAPAATIDGDAHRDDTARMWARLDRDAEAETGIWGPGGFRGRFSAIHHTLEPFTALRFTSRTDEDELPLYDTIDRIDDRSTGTYGIASRFLFTQAASGRTAELARLSLAQSYNFSEKVLDDHFSDVDATLAIRPVQNVSFAGLASYNVGTNALQGAAAALALDSIELPFTNTRRTEVDAAYRFVRCGAVGSAAEGLETLEARTILAITDTLAIGLNGRYDFVSNEFVESGGGFRIESSCRCWTVDIGVVNRVNPDETQFRLQVELGGLGSLGRSALEYQTPGLAGFDYGMTESRRYGW